ncbi:putative ubiquitin-conjugating enzyme e2 [Haematococcus lacustris]
MESAARTIQAQLDELLQGPPPGVTAGPDDDDLFQWTGIIQGPPGTPYEGGVFFLDIQFPDNYPFEPPRVKFTTPLYHPNVNDKGGICLSILFQGCTWDQGWSPAMSISSVLLSLTILLQEPNTDHSLRPDLAAQYLADREAYNTAAREHTKQHAM